MALLAFLIFLINLTAFVLLSISYPTLSKFCFIACLLTIYIVVHKTYIDTKGGVK
jgi:hypothetical protein